MLPQSKLVIGVAGLSVASGATSTSVMDTLGYDFATIDVIIGTTGVTSSNATVFDLVEADVATTSSAVTVSGFVGDTDWTIPVGDTSNSTGIKFNVDLRGRKRYLGIRYSPLTAQLVVVAANLSRGDEAPVSTTKAGVVALIEG